MPELLRPLIQEESDISLRQKLFRWMEFTFLFIAAPILVLRLEQVSVAFMILWLLTVMALAFLRKTQGLAWRQIWRFEAVTRRLALRMALGAGVAGVCLAGFLNVYQPQLLFGFIRQRPDIFLVMALLYPVLSAMPQEVVYRAFFFHRYQLLLGNSVLMVVSSAAAFAFAHIIFGNWLAPTLCLIGGLLFSITYWKTRSLAAATLQHALYGLMIFTVGLGPYFYRHGGEVLERMKTEAAASR